MRRLAPVALLVLASCATMQCDTLYFGTAKPDGTAVTSVEWSSFVSDTISPRFPGFTEWEADGHWKGEREKTHIVVIVHGPGEDTAIAEIIAAYTKRFAQEAVLRLRTRCSGGL